MTLSDHRPRPDAPAAPRPRPGVAQRPLTRATDLAIVGGVCAGLAVRLGLRERTVRVVFALFSLAWGLGLLVYVGMWLFTPRFGESESIGRRLSRHEGLLQTALWGTAIVVVVLLLTGSVVVQGTGGFVWTVVLAGLGVVAAYRGASPDERAQLDTILESSALARGARARGWRGVLIRLIPGVLFLVIGLTILSRVGGIWGVAVPALVGAAVVIGGLMILLAPWWLQNVRDLTRERRERVRVEERNALALHVHDSVLQTLTLIERAAPDNPDVLRLARSQERALREWLFDPSASRPDPTVETLASMVSDIQRDVERDYGVKVEVVVVGDVAADDGVAALAGAGREACVNAAKWSGASTVSIYAEAEESRVSLYVRDTGTGFDLGAVAADRHGISRSIRERLDSVGGGATFRTSPGAGTDVELWVPRSDR
ncbi:MAG TPA: PspC domain-containing protein [Acidimicrobiales bacterium]|nr:PspC domain-containing protein [Acidimicrobiales bacterium]